jgi:hypothetical protein
LSARDEQIQNIYFTKFPEKKNSYGDPDEVFFIFKPIWWRYTDYKAPKEKRITLSTQ